MCLLSLIYEVSHIGGKHGTFVSESSQRLSKLTLLLVNLVPTHKQRFGLPLARLDSLK